MRTLIKFTIPVEAGNAGISDGTLPKVIGEVVDRLKPEAAYFFPDRGLRSGIMVFDMKDASDIPSVVEPLFRGLNASVEIMPAMNADDLKKGLAKVSR